jgi:hypothetical protein
MNSLWRSLEDVPAHSAAAADWKLHLGGAFAAACKVFLQETKRKASSVQCPYAEGCAYRLTPRGNGFVGKCKNDDGQCCDDVMLTMEEAEVWEVNLKRLGAAIARALQCVGKDQRLEVERTRQIASLGTAPPLPILLTVQHDAEGFSNVVARLVTRLPKGFVLFAPTSRFCTATATEMLDRVDAGFFDLESHVGMTDDGTLRSIKPGRELFGSFLPKPSQPIPDNVVQLMFAALEKLGAKKQYRKAPLLEVLRLYCIKKYSRNKVAQNCRCVPSLITLRLKEIENAFGRPPKALRESSTHLEAAQKAYLDSRAKSVYRRGLTDDTISEDDEE